MKLVRHRDETLQLMLSSVEHEWSSSPPEAVRGTARSFYTIVCSVYMMAIVVDQADYWFARHWNHLIISKHIKSCASLYHHDP